MEKTMLTLQKDWNFVLPVFWGGFLVLLSLDNPNRHKSQVLVHVVSSNLWLFVLRFTFFS
jgi:hypothetical protein